MVNVINHSTQSCHKYPLPYDGGGEEQLFGIYISTEDKLVFIRGK